MRLVPRKVGTADRRAESRFSFNRESAPASPTRAVSFFPVVTYPSGELAPNLVTVADVNGDGKLDLVVANQNSNTVGLLLGNGDGTFQAAVTYGSGGRSPSSVEVADVNGDSKPDLVVANGCGTTCASGEVGVLLGNGDGTFQPAVTYCSCSSSFSWSVVVADVNADGKPDLIVADECDNYPTCAHGTVGVLPAMVTEHSRQPPFTSQAGRKLTRVAVADVNGDGKLDLIVGNNCFSCSSTVSVQHQHPHKPALRPSLLSRFSHRIFEECNGNSNDPITAASQSQGNSASQWVHHHERNHIGLQIFDWRRHL